MNLKAETLSYQVCPDRLEGVLSLCDDAEETQRNLIEWIREEAREAISELRGSLIRAVTEIENLKLEVNALTEEKGKLKEDRDLLELRLNHLTLSTLIRNTK